RHTRFSRDWSSDVCSSDLSANQERLVPAPQLTVMAARSESKCCCRNGSFRRGYIYYRYAYVALLFYKVLNWQHFIPMKGMRYPLFSCKAPPHTGRSFRKQNPILNESSRMWFLDRYGTVLASVPEAYCHT